MLAVLLLLPLHSAGNFLRAPVEWHTPESFRQPLTSLTAFRQPKNSSEEEKAQPEESVSKASEKVENTALTNSGEASQLPTNSRNKTASSDSAGAGSDASFEQQNPAQPSAEPHESGLTTVASALTKTLKSVTALEVLALVWIGGMLVLGVRQAWGYLRFKRYLWRTCHPLQDVEVLAQLKALAARLRLRKIPSLKQCPMLATPMLVGLVAPTLILPCTDFTPEQLQLVLTHELVHYRRKDLWYRLIVQLAYTVHWLNPLVKWMVNQAGLDLEFACDDEVMLTADVRQRGIYCEALLKTAEEKSAPGLAHRAKQGAWGSTGFSQNKKILQARFARLFDTGLRHTGGRLLALLCVAALMLTGLVSCSEASTASSSETKAWVETAQHFSVTPEEQQAVLPQVQVGQWFTNPHSMDAAAFYGDPTFEFGFLWVEDLLGPYLTESGDEYDFPSGFLEEIASFFQPGCVDEDVLNWYFGWASDYQVRDYFEETYDYWRAEPEGTIFVKVTDSFQGKPLYETVYELESTVAQNVPKVLQGLYTEGQPYWKVIWANRVAVYQSDVEEAPLVIEIYTPQELLDAAQKINEDGERYRHTTFRLMADLDMSGVEWTPIGLDFCEEPYEKPEGFKGVFNGNGHVIRNLTVSTVSVKSSIVPTASTYAYTGMFAVIHHDGLVQNLTLENGTVDWTAPEDENSVVEQGSALLAGTNEGTITNCCVKNSVINSDYEAAALVGSSPGMISKCQVQNCRINGSYSAAGLAAEVCGGKISDCTVTDTQVFCNGFSGGFIGAASIGSSLTRCSFEGTVTVQPGIYDDPPNTVGGFAGLLADSTLTECTVSAPVLTLVSSNIIGCFAGYGSNTTFTDCTYRSGLSPWKALGDQTQEVTTFPTEIG